MGHVHGARTASPVAGGRWQDAGLLAHCLMHSLLVLLFVCMHACAYDVACHACTHMPQHHVLGGQQELQFVKGTPLQHLFVLVLARFENVMNLLLLASKEEANAAMRVCA